MKKFGLNSINVMDSKETTLQKLHDKIKKGLDLTFRKLVAEKRKNDGVFVFSKDGKIIEVKAVDIKD